MKQNLIGEGFMFIPKDENQQGEEKYVNRINILGEIVAAENFEAEDIYIIYEFVKPDFYKYEFDDTYYDEIHQPESELKRESSMTQSATSVVEKNEQGQTIIRANFSFPIDWQLKVDKDLMEINKGPCICFQVNSIDQWERIQIEGYGFCEIPKTPGHFEMKLQTWKPIERGSLKVKDLKSIAKSYFLSDQNKPSIINRVNLKTESAGEIILRFDVVIQSIELKQICKQMYKEKNNAIRKREKYNELQQQQDQQDEMMEGPSLMKNQFTHYNRFSAAQINTQI